MLTDFAGCCVHGQPGDSERVIMKQVLGGGGDERFALLARSPLNSGQFNDFLRLPFWKFKGYSICIVKNQIRSKRLVGFRDKI